MKQRKESVAPSDPRRAVVENADFCLLGIPFVRLKNNESRIFKKRIAQFSRAEN